ncbi:M12 family metallo-peptidase [Kibdelosporangium persicum]|uniref:Metallo-peptidase family M12B Reprolysin-like n=1 Tax=Kibdelosporangium persicum TaxID=2698649 RepID=A0ABX2FEW8_9PSEU|nr:M12 family metallo-peptidase [Kibdelosporangium persicum]NRN69912.1 Metallo-peptidase family M12B Reprolysin-like [Kibdelosporangium persicum]
MERSRLWSRPARSLTALAIAGLAVALMPVLSTTAPAAPTNPWTKADPASVAARSAKQADIRTSRFAGFTLDRTLMQGQLGMRAAAAQEVLLPTPEGTFQRFSLVDAPVMEEGLAAAHPEIRTYAGKGIDDPTASVRADLTPLGFHASVRSENGSWFVDPYYHRDQSLYASYYGHDVQNPSGPLQEKGIVGVAKEVQAAIDKNPVVKLRTYRLALITDPSYANYFGAENVTAAKVTLINRVAQIYEDETAIRLVLIKDTDKTNLNTPAMASEPNGPCGAAPCFKPEELEFCDIPTLFATGIALGQLVGADSYDVGHIGLGVNGGGIAGLGVVGGQEKAVGCTGLPTPVGDFYAVDYVAHEIGHQFGGNHTFNGTEWNCSAGNREPTTSVEPGSGSSIMAYAGICQQDNLQPHSDPYWSHQSYTEITSYITSDLPAINEQQDVSLRGFDGDDSFTLSYKGQTSAPIVRGVNYTPAGVKAAVESITGATVTVAGFGDQPDYRPMPFDDTGFQVTFGGALAGVNVDSLGVTVNGGSGFAGESIKGGPVDNKGFKVTDTRNHAPVVKVPSSYTIPVRTPFALTGSAKDQDGDAVTYMWEQNDRGKATGTALVDNVKKDGPLFRQFGTAAIVSDADTLKYYSPGQNAVNRNPTRVFPDMAQILANNTNAKTGACPPAPPKPPSGGKTNVPPELIDCYSEFLPTADWVGFNDDRTMHFRLTARDARHGGGGIGIGDTAVKLVPTAGPFLVTSQGAAGALAGGSKQTITWDVAGTNAAPINVKNVKISLSTDGGKTFPHVIARSTANDGSEQVKIPDLATTTARIRIEAVGNIFFDVNDADFTINASPRVTSPQNIAVQYSDALAPVTITAEDPDSAGSVLTAVAAGLPAGLAVAPGTADGNKRTWTISGTTTDKPGTYPVAFTVTDNTGVASTLTVPITVKPEDAEVTYAGDSLVYGDSVLFRATIRDNTDVTPGDVKKANVTFSAGGKALCTATVGLLGTGTSDGSGGCVAKLPQGVTSVSVSAGGNYAGTATTSVDAQASQKRTVLAAGVITATKSAGAYRADHGTPVNVSALLVHNNAKTTGLSTVRFRSGGKEYLAFGNNVESFGARTSGSLDVRAKVLLTDVTSGQAMFVAAGVTLHVTQNGRNVAVTLMQGDKLLFSSDWTGAKTREIPLNTGGFLIA